MNELLGVIIVVALVSTLLLSFHQASFSFKQESYKYNDNYNLQTEADIFRHKVRNLIVNAGYGMDSIGSTSVVEADSTKFVFLTNDPALGVVKTEISTRAFTTDPTYNPNDFQIIHKINDVYSTDFSLVGLTRFSFEFYDNNFNLLSFPISNMKDIKVIAYNYTIQGADPFASGNTILNTDYPTTSGREVIFGKNLFDWNVIGG
ncbi:MAG: hypothetical protein K8S23_02025 [Candidatus Cloacimonetes bacterium]|nr:hypothetical protein [Candidatus Cloacimonadota bacterium]